MPRWAPCRSEFPHRETATSRLFRPPYYDSELNCGILLVEVVQSCLQCVTLHDSESVIDEAKPQSWTIGHGGDGVALEVLHEDIGYYWRDGRSHGEIVRHLVEFFAELERCVLQADCQKLDNGGDRDRRLEFP